MFSLLLDITIDLSGQAKTQKLSSANSTFGDYVGTILQAVMVIGLLMVLVFLVWGATEWITAGGESGKVDKARQKITGAIMGMLALAATIALFTLVQNLLGIKVLRFA
jgi:hypothetical protein